MCAFIGWFTNLVAIKMMFRPYERIQIIGPIGWQGILAREAERFARDIADIVVEEFLTPRDLVRQIDPAVIRETLNPLLLEAIDTGLAKFVDELPAVVRQGGLVSASVISVIRKQILDEIDRLAPEIRDLVIERINPLIDLRSEIIKNLTGGNLERLENLIMTVSAKEFRWITYQGAIFGALIACIQIGLFSAGFRSAWITPVVGVIVGLTTHWLAIVMLFSPRHPVNLGLFTLQGVFAGRQKEIALSMAQVMSQEMKFGEMFDLMFERGFGGELRTFATARLEQFLNVRLQTHLTVLAAVDVEVSPEKIADDMIMQVADRLPAALAEVKRVAESQTDVMSLVQSSLEDMDKLRFEQVLRGLYKQDEIILIAYGGLLGGMIGLVQMGVAELFR